MFISRDPLAAITRSPYGYVGGNPLNGVDPSGADPSDVYCAVSSHVSCPGDPVAEVRSACRDNPDGCRDDLKNIYESIKAQIEVCSPESTVYNAQQAHLQRLVAARDYAVGRLRNGKFGDDGYGVSVNQEQVSLFGIGCAEGAPAGAEATLPFAELLGIPVLLGAVFGCLGLGGLEAAAG